MGLINSRRSHNIEEADTTAANLYRYPPKSGCYFGSYFIMGGERFETNLQDTYLFGENEDLNFLGNKPVPFPYHAPSSNGPTRTLKSLVNIRRDSLKFVRETDSAGHNKREGDTTSSSSPRYNVEFTFDSDVKCAITVYYFASEEIINKQAVYHPRDPKMNSETFHYKRGANQVFSQSTHVIEPTQFSEDDWQYSFDKEQIPVVIQCVVEEEDFIGHSHATFAVVDKSCDGGYVLKCLKQKQMIDGVYYLLQEIYGIENKNVERAKQEDDIEDNGSECVICMCETRDTLILPCRHLCLCNSCADNLRYQANNCPICRSKFSALLQICAVRRKLHNIGGIGGSLPSNLLSSRPMEPAEEWQQCQDGVPPGYEAVSLIEALNGPTLPQCALSASVLHTDVTVQSLSSVESPRDDGPQVRDEPNHVGVACEPTGQINCTELTSGFPSVGSSDQCEGKLMSNGVKPALLPEIKVAVEEEDAVLESDVSDDRLDQVYCKIGDDGHRSPIANHSVSCDGLKTSVQVVNELQKDVDSTLPANDVTPMTGNNAGDKHVQMKRVHTEDINKVCGTQLSSDIDTCSKRLLATDVTETDATNHWSPDGSCNSTSSSSKELLDADGGAETTDSELCV